MKRDTTVLKKYLHKKVVVTGGAGFIGSHLVDQLIALGANVTVLDNLATGSLKNLTHVQHQITFIKGDIRCFKTCLDATRDAFCIFHLAAQVSVPESMENPFLCNEINITGTYNLLEAARLNNVSRFMFSSSCAVYGHKDIPCSETTPCNPTSVYAYSKLYGEQLCKEYSSLFSVPTLCLRYFNVFGPRQNPHGHYAGVIAKFQAQFSTNQPITIFGNGLQSRDFVPVQQIVQANVGLALASSDLFTGQPINIATGTSTSILELFHKLKKEFPSYTFEPLFAPFKKGDIVSSQAECSLYKQLISSFAS